MDSFTLELVIHGERLPGASFGPYRDLRIGVQKGEAVEQETPGDTDTVEFRVSLQVKRHAKEGHPVFSGPYVFGPSRTPFLYLSWSGEQDGERTRFSRAKLPLAPLEWGALMTAHDTGQPLRLTLDLTDDKGGPLCGGVDSARLTYQAGRS